MKRIYWRPHSERFLLYKFRLNTCSIEFIVLVRCQTLLIANRRSTVLDKNVSHDIMSALRPLSIVLTADVTKWLRFSVFSNPEYPCRVQIDSLNNTDWLLYINAHVRALIYTYMYETHTNASKRYFFDRPGFTLSSLFSFRSTIPTGMHNAIAITSRHEFVFVFFCNGFRIVNVWLMLNG